MPNIWFHESSNNWHSMNKERKEYYTVVSAERINVYHYHGSWFEYTWNLLLKSENGEDVRGEFDTWYNYQSLNGKMIEYDGNIFKVIE